MCDALFEHQLSDRHQRASELATLSMERIPGTTLRRELETRRERIGIRQARLLAEDLFSVPV